MQEARIRIGLAANLRLFVVALAIGGVLGALAVVGIVGAALDELARLDAPADPYAYAPASQRDEILSVLVPALLFVSAVLPIVCLRLRSGRRARVTWDEAGVTEWEGEGVRAFIPRASARVTAETKTFQRHRRGRVYTFVARAIAQVSDADGRRITIGQQSLLRALFFFGLPGWMRRRPALAPWTAVAALSELGPATAPGTPIVPDERGARRPYGRLSSALHVGAIVTGGLALWMIGTQHSAAEPAGLALLAAGAFLLVAVVRPLGEIARLRRAGQPFTAAQQVSFRIAPDGATSVTLPDGRTMPADASALRHPDARVLTRGGTVRAALEVSAGGDAYRGAPAQAIVRAVETDAERAERRRLIFANLLEVVARVVHALLVLTIGVLVVTRIQGF